MKTQYQVYNEGWKARQQLQHWSDNPYVNSWPNSAWDDWMDGWTDANSELFADNAFANG